MTNKKEVTARIVSAVHTELLSSPSPLAKELQYVGADTEQSPNVTNHSITNYQPKNNRKVLETISMTELYDTVYPGKPPLIDGLLYPGIYLFAGAPKVGKSFLMAQFAYHISRGISLWDYPVRPCTVLYLALEDDYRRLQERFYRMFGTEGVDRLFFSVTAGNLENGLDEQLQEFMRDHAGTRLVIIDTLQKVREAGGDCYSYANDYEIITRLKRLADSYGICILLVHHTRKQGADDKFDMISGTTGLLGAADGAFLLHKEKRTGNAATLEISGRDQQDQKLYLSRNTETLLWELEKAEIDLWRERPEPLLEEIAGRVMKDCLQWEGTATELAALLGVEIQPNVLTQKLNIQAGRLFREYGICYDRKRCHGGRKVLLWKEKEEMA